MGSAIIRHVILDRDGVLNAEAEHQSHISDPAGFRWLPGALDALARLRALGLRISVATNQSGVGRGLMTQSQLDAVHMKMAAEARAAHGDIDAIFCCIHAPEARCACRKPQPGLIAAAIAQATIGRDGTLVVGDDRRDLDAAHAAGVAAVLLRTGKGRRHEAYALQSGIPIFDDLADLAARLAAGDGHAGRHPA